MENNHINISETPESEKWVNLEDVADHLSMSKDAIRAWVRNGKLPAYKAGKMYKFKLSEVDEWVREGRIKD
ncbi:MAG TPA: helix-turn-helix domain-containing protein [Bacillota bacterium]|nr:helix-turn-helix domain-containing protein [Bacillota bacterium]HQC48486.1 helix-turn-helix domain-containing protein [Bacillota bacterium]